MNECVFHEDIKDQVKDHEDRIHQIEVKEASYEANFGALCKRLDDLITVIKWFIGITISMLPIGIAIIELCNK